VFVHVGLGGLLGLTGGIGGGGGGGGLTGGLLGGQTSAASAGASVMNWILLKNLPSQVRLSHRYE